VSVFDLSSSVILMALHMYEYFKIFNLMLKNIRWLSSIPSPKYLKVVVVCSFLKVSCDLHRNSRTFVFVARISVG
jgi:hypothetical protein